MRRMARSVGPMICLLLVAMDVIAGILGIEAEIAQNKESYVRVDVFECRQPSYQAYKLGVGALVLLALAHAIANALGGCVCVSSRHQFRTSTPNKQVAFGSLLFSWIIFIIGFTLLVVGTVPNSRPKGTCAFSHSHVFAVGGILCFIHGLFLVPYYVSANAVSEEDDMMIPA